jgi:hypothetical protein
MPHSMQNNDKHKDTDFQRALALIFFESAQTKESAATDALHQNSFIHAEKKALSKLKWKHPFTNWMYSSLKRKLNGVIHGAEDLNLNLLNMDINNEKHLTNFANDAVSDLVSIRLSNNYISAANTNLIESFVKLSLSPAISDYINQKQPLTDEEHISIFSLALDMMRETFYGPNDTRPPISVELTRTEGSYAQLSAHPHAAVVPVSLRTIFAESTRHVVIVNMHENANNHAPLTALANLSYVSAQIRQSDLANKVLRGAKVNELNLYEDGLNIAFMHTLNNHVAQLVPNVHNNNFLNADASQAKRQFENKFLPYLNKQRSLKI